MKDTIQTSLEYLSDLCLEYSANYEKYSDRDLVNATIILSHILMAKTYEYHIKKTQDQKEKIAENLGKKLRKYILEAKGKDLHKLVKDL